MPVYRTATQWGVYHVQVEDNQIVDVLDHDNDPDPSALGKGLLDGIQHPLRIKRPAIRKSWLESRSSRGRGSDEFVDVSWDEALSLASDELRRVIDTHGNPTACKVGGQRDTGRIEGCLGHSVVIAATGAVVGNRGNRLHHCWSTTNR